MTRPLAALSLLAALAAWPGVAAPPAPAVTVFRNVRVFDGKSDALADGMDVVVEGERIMAVSKSPAKVPAGASILDGAGRVLMPGLIDAHVHATVGLAPDALLRADAAYVAVRGAAELSAMLDRGFTSVRDMGGNTFGLKRAIDEGRVRGPRVFPSGAIVSQTSGHGDYRFPSDRPRRFGGPLGRAEQLGVAFVADGPDEVLVAVREQLRLGATQVKLASGGGVLSPSDPVDVNEYTDAELRAATDAARDWGTYVAVHVYTDAGCRRSIDAGVGCLEHAHLIGDATLKLAAQKNVFVSTQVLTFLLPFTDDPKMQRKNDLVKERIPAMLRSARKNGAKICFGTDLLLDPRLLAAQSAELAARLDYGFTPAEVLRQATGVNGELLALCGRRNSYDDSTPLKIGVVEPGAVADLLLVDGNPLENLELLVDWNPHKNPRLLGEWNPDQTPRPVEFGKNLVAIMKAGRFYKGGPAVRAASPGTP